MNRQHQWQMTRKHQHYQPPCGDAKNNGTNLHSIVHGNESDLLWEDDSNEIPMATLSYKNSNQLSSSSLSSTSSISSSDGVFEEDFVHQRHNCLDQEDCFEDNNSRGSSSSVSTLSFANPAKGANNSNIVLDSSSVVEKIEEFILQTVIEPLSEKPNPSVPEIDVEVDQLGYKRKLSFYHLSQARPLTSIILVASFCHNLLAAPIMDEENNGEEGSEDVTIDGNMDNQGRQCHRHPLLRKTTTTREVYYFYVTYFRDQRECDKAIWDLVRILNLPSRQCLGLVASPKGWFCGSIDVYNAHTNELKFNGRELDAHGMAITPSTYDNPYHQNDHDEIDPFGSNGTIDAQNIFGIRIESDARCILVIEKEGIYTRLSEDKFFLRYFPCILVTGKGFPDIATRRWVWRMQKALNIPVYGLCDCNPYGVSVLDTYRHHQGVKLSVDRNRSADTEEKDPFAMEWIGLCPSQIEKMDLPSEVFQELTSNDIKRLDSLLVPAPSGCRSFVERGRDKAKRLRELRAMRKYKVELEALHWKGTDYLSRFVHETVMKHESELAAKRQKNTGHTAQHDAIFDCNDGCDSGDKIPNVTIM